MADNPEHSAPEGSSSGSNLSLIIFSLLCVAAALLFMGIVAFQVMEYLYYREPPSVWPTPTAAGRQPLASPVDAVTASPEGRGPSHVSGVATTGLTANVAAPDSSLAGTGAPSPSAVSESNSVTNAPAASGEAKPEISRTESPP